MRAGILNRYRLGIVGGLGPLASADLYEKITRLTPAASDQDHFASVLLSIPQTPDRSAAIRGSGPSPLPGLLDAVATLNRLGVQLVAIGCNTAHHWYDTLAAASDAPILHIADAAIAEFETRQIEGPVAVLATRGVIASGFYERKLLDRGVRPHIPDEKLQCIVDRAIAAVKAGDFAAATQAAAAIAASLRRLAIPVVLLACTELPIAWSGLPDEPARPLLAIDINQAFAQAIVCRLSSHATTAELPRSDPTIIGDRPAFSPPPMHLAGTGQFASPHGVDYLAAYCQIPPTRE